MSKNRKPIVLEDYKAKKAEEGAISVKAGDRLFIIPPPVLWSDVVLDNIETNPPLAARSLLGDDYDAFVEAGGSAAIIMSLIADEHGMTAGES